MVTQLEQWSKEKVRAVIRRFIIS